MQRAVKRQAIHAIEFVPVPYFCITSGKNLYMHDSWQYFRTGNVNCTLHGVIPLRETKRYDAVPFPKTGKRCCTVQFVFSDRETMLHRTISFLLAGKGCRTVQFSFFFVAKYAARCSLTFRIKFATMHGAGLLLS